MAAKYILVLASAIFLLLAIARIVKDGMHIGPASRTWLIVGCIFGLVSLWLWIGGRA